MTVMIESDYRSDYFLKGVYLEYYKNRNVSGAPSEKAVKVYENQTTTGYSYSGTVNESALPITGVDTFKKGLFYVIAVVQSKTDEEDLQAEMTAILDWNAVYSIGMICVNDMLAVCKAGKCDVPDALEQVALTWHALELAMAANDADMMDKLWGRFILSDTAMPSSGSTCNCM